MMREYGLEIVIIVGLALVIVLMVGFTVAAGVSVRCDPVYRGAVMDGYYQKPESSNGSGVVMFDGKPGVVAVHSGTVEKWVLIMRLATGEVVSQEVSAAEYYNALEKVVVNYRQCYSVLGNVTRYKIVGDGE